MLCNHLGMCCTAFFSQDDISDAVQVLKKERPFRLANQKSEQRKDAVVCTKQTAASFIEPFTIDYLSVFFSF